MAAKQEMIHDEVSEEILACVDRLARQRSAEKITVRDVLKELGITNRVFYNRFHNMDEVLNLLYQKMIHQVRESLMIPWQEGTDFLAHVKRIAAQTLIVSYTCKENLSRFVFDTDSVSDENYRWWVQEIKKLIALGQQHGQIREDLDGEMLSYAVWCFIRGFNADAMARNLSREEALTRFDYGFSIFLEGIRA